MRERTPIFNLFERSVQLGCRGTCDPSGEQIAIPVLAASWRVPGVRIFWRLEIWEILLVNEMVA